MANRIRTVKLTESERAVLEERARSQTLPQREVERARIVLLSADGKSNAEIQSALGVSRTKVQRWLDRYEEGGSEAVRTDLPRPGAPVTITPGKEAEVVRRTLEGPPAGAGTHWSTRTLAPVVGVSPASVGRIWKAHGLHPHRARTFELSNDPQFVEKLHDVVGLYVIRRSGREEAAPVRARRQPERLPDHAGGDGGARPRRGRSRSGAGTASGQESRRHRARTPGRVEGREGTAGEDDA